MEFLLEMIVEALLQGVGDLIFDCLLRSQNPVLRTLGAAMFSALVGALLGSLSLVLLRTHLIGSWELRVGLLVVLPLANGIVMSRIGRSFERKEKPRSAFEYFFPAFVFSLVFGAARFFGAR